MCYAYYAFRRFPRFILEQQLKHDRKYVLPYLAYSLLLIVVNIRQHIQSEVFGLALAK